MTVALGIIVQTSLEVKALLHASVIFSRKQYSFVAVKPVIVSLTDVLPVARVIVLPVSVQVPVFSFC